MPLPSPDSLSLSETVALVKERCGVSRNEAKKALQRAGLDGRLEVNGATPLSAHPDPAVRARHPARKIVNIPADAWNAKIDWVAGTIGLYFTVSIKRASIEAWLGAARLPPSISFRKATDPQIIEEIRAQYDAADARKRKPPNVKEIVPLVQGALRAQGFDTSGQHIQDLAGPEEFQKRRRKPGATVKNDRRRQVQ